MPHIDPDILQHCYSLQDSLWNLKELKGDKLMACLSFEMIDELGLVDSNRKIVNVVRFLIYSPCLVPKDFMLHRFSLL